MKAINLFSLFLCLILISCTNESEPEASDISQRELTLEPVNRNLGDKFQKIDIRDYGIQKGRVEKSRFLSLYSAEFITDLNSGESGNTVIFMNVGNRRTASDFSPTNTLNGTENIFFYIDTSRPSEDLAIDITTHAISQAMNTWDNLSCSDPRLIQIPSDNNFSTGLVAALLGYASDVPVLSEINHVGWMGADFFEMALGEGSSESVLGVTFLFVWTDENNNTFDTNNDGRPDAALREIYYNDAFSWSEDASAINVESIALHESGHAFSQGHFGKLFQTTSNERYHFAPRAVMNAGYTGGEFTSPTGTDVASHCNNWATWPEE